MNREEVIKMALEAGWSGLYIQWAEPTGLPDWKSVKESLTVPVNIEQIERFASLVAAHEREACEVACKQLEIAIDGGGNVYYRPADARQCVAAIRERGTEK